MTRNRHFDTKLTLTKDFTPPELIFCYSTCIIPFLTLFLHLSCATLAMLTQAVIICTHISYKYFTTKLTTRITGAVISSYYSPLGMHYQLTLLFCNITLHYTVHYYVINVVNIIYYV